ncbi:MAG: RDD family protein, partial [Pseudobdellovibrionaceae bacterium]
MVFQDLGYAFDTEKNNHSLKAPVLADRIVACFVDIVLNSPFLFLFLSPLIRLFEENNFYGDLEVSWSFFLAVFFLGFHLFVISIALQTHLLGHTFGQKIMQIEIVHTIKNFSQKQKISFWSSFQRSYGYGISLLFFGLPLLEMMIHPQRFSFYERMSNSYAVSNAHRFDFPPTILEILFARVVLSFSFGAIVLFGCISFVKKIESQKVASLMAMRDRGFLCEDLPAELQLPMERLEMAIAHYYVTNKIDCLLMEEKNISQMDAKFAEIDEQHKDMFYLARSITQSDPEINFDYENKICQENDQNLLSADWKESCLLAQFFSERSSESREDHNSELQTQLQQIPKKSFISLLILQDHFQSDKNYEMSFAYW